METLEADSQTGTSTLNFANLLEKQREHFQKVVRHTTWRERVKKLRAIRHYVFSHKDEICEALHKDFRKPKSEVLATEILPLSNELRFAIRNLDLWMKRKKVITPVAMLGARSWIIQEPKGVILVITPWNYPFLLSIGPMVSAIASGNCVILKPSELTSHISAFIKKMVEELFPEEEIAVCEGDQEVSKALLELHFDHIHFTGGPAVGKLIMQAAAKNLIPVTLELGGQNPAIVDQTVNVKDAAKKILWGKFVNNGQSCVAVNHLLVDNKVLPALLVELIRLIELEFGKKDEIINSPDLARIINLRHLKRIQELVTTSVEMGAKISFGGIIKEDELYISPTFVTDLKMDHPLLQDEIFGPILPIIGFNNLEEAIQMVNARPNPLALYIFSRSRKNIKQIINNTRAGTTAINEVKLQFANPALPFGGVGNSGIGKSHGYHGFLDFSNARGMIKNNVGFTVPKLFYPPYGRWKEKVLSLVAKWLG